MMTQPDTDVADDLYDPNEAVRRRQQSLWLGAAAVLAVFGLIYIWMQLAPSPHRTVDETRRRILATADLARSPDPPEVVNGDLKRQVQQLEQQNADLQTQNLQLADAAKAAETARNVDRTDAMRTISALEDEVNRKRGEPAPPAPRPPPLIAAAPAPPAQGGDPAPSLALAPPGAGSGEGAPMAPASAPPRRSMVVVRAGATEPALAPTPKTAPDEAPSAPPFANRGDSAPAVSQRGEVQKASAFMTGRLEAFATADFVPPNAYAAAEVLVGVDSATSVNSAADPKPVLLRLLGDAFSVGSDGRYQRTRLRGCLVNGAAYGELSSEKVYVKLQRITCPAGPQQFAVATVEGYVSQRGKAGVRGVVVERAGGLTTRAAIAGTLQGLGTTLSQNLSRSAGGVTAVAGPGGVLGAEKLSGGELARGAVGGGVANAASQLAEYYIKRAEQYQPVIEMPTGIEVEIVFLTGFQIRGPT